MSRRRWCGLVAAGGLTLAASLAPAAASAQDLDGVLELSGDGVRWSPRLTEPLFDPKVRWVPGDVRTVDFWLRHRGPTDADVDVDVAGRGLTALLDSGDLLLEGRAAGGAWRDLLDEETALLNDVALPAGRPVRVDLRATLLDGAPNGTMRLAADLDLRVSVRDSALSGGTVSPGAPGGPGAGVDAGGDPGDPDGDGAGAGAPDRGAGAVEGGVPSGVDAGLSGLLPDVGDALRPTTLLPLALLLGVLATVVRRRTARARTSDDGSRP